MLQISWTRGADLPQGVQESDGGFLGDLLISVGGYCGGSEEGNRSKPGRYPVGFLNQAWAIDVGNPNAKWQSLPAFPGTPRQGLFAAVVGDVLFFWGGFNYSAPNTYADGFAMSRARMNWHWKKMPPLPGPRTSAGAAVVGTRIYVFGGADYDGTRGFFTASDRDGARPRLGASLLVLDTRDIEAGWHALPDCPGTPRFVHAFAAVSGKLYAIGGATGGSPTCTVVDNWRFDPSAGKWERIRDLPISSGNFSKGTNLAFKDRYLVLVGGYQYGAVATPEGAFRANYGTPSRHSAASGLCNDVFVYDTRNDCFGTADKLPIDNNLPMAVVRDDEIFLLGGETGGATLDGEYYANHPDLMLRGRIKPID